jgi:hypothetical protein
MATGRRASARHRARRRRQSAAHHRRRADRGPDPRSVCVYHLLAELAEDRTVLLRPTSSKTSRCSARSCVIRDGKPVGRMPREAREAIAGTIFEGNSR